MSSIEKVKVLVAYHSNCIDGFTSAWITHRALVNKVGYKVELLAMSYTEESDNELYNKLGKERYLDLYVVDFSLSIRLLNDLAKEYPTLNVVILDHHKTAFEKYAPDIKVEKDTKWEGWIGEGKVSASLDNSLSGAGICWDYFYPGEPVPWIVKYVQDYDLWEFKYGKGTKYINKVLNQATYNPSL